MTNKLHIGLFLFFILISSCKEKQQDEDNKKTTQVAHTEGGVEKDTVITHRQKGASAKARVYFPIVRKDTIAFEISFATVKNSPVSAKIYFKNELTYKAHYPFIRLILEKASKDFMMSELNMIYLGTLSGTGDLAIDIMRKLMRDHADLEALIQNYDTVSSLLMETKMTSDINMLLKPYHLRVGGYNLEKVFLANAASVFQESLLDTKTNDIPEKILDAIVWVKIEQIESAE